jgi:hypothetical protein
MTRFKRGDIVKESGEIGIVLQTGKIAYDIVWTGGSTSRYKYSTGRHVHLATAFELDGQDDLVISLREEAEVVRGERARGEGVRRRQLYPSR